MNSRQSARLRPRNGVGPRLSPWHYVALGLVALLGTGVLAAIDRSGERAASLQADGRVQSRAEVVLAGHGTAPDQVPVVTAPKAPVSTPFPAQPGAAQAAPAASAAGINNAFLPGPIELSAARPRAAPPAVAPSPPPVVQPAPEPKPQAEGPVVTASLAPPAAPAPLTRPAVTAAPQAAKPQETAPQGAATRGAVKTSAATSTDCLPASLRAVLADVAARFGEVTVVSTHQLHTANHSSGSIREKLHHDCKAVDIRPDRSRIDEIKAYLRARPDIGGVESYRNGVIHMDVSGTAAASARPQARPGRGQKPEQDVPADALASAPVAPQEGQSASVFTPVVNERYR